MIHKLRASLFWLALTPAVFVGCNGTLIQNNPDEICDNGVDDDGDGLADCDDSNCAATDECTIPEDCGNGTLDAGELCDGALLGGQTCDDFPPNNAGTLACNANCTFNTAGCSVVAVTEDTEATCANGSDDDNDSFIDCADTGCVGTNACVGVENCGDGIDNDFDNAVDCADVVDCAADVRCGEDCDDTIDNDLDGDIDCADANCNTDPACNGQVEICNNGLPENDGDALVDCQDPDCFADVVSCPQNSPDLDCDGIANAAEAAFGTSATNADSDGDGILDGLETGAIIPVPGSNCPGFVADADPLTTTNPNDPDTDNDGLCDDGVAVAGVCVAGEDDNGNGRIDNLESDPTVADTDGDGLDDGDENTLGTDPTDNDSDNDGLLDGAEDANGNGIRDTGETNALSADTDCDGLADGTEVNGTTDPTRADTDGDAISDGVELSITAPVNGTNCVNVRVDADPTTNTDPLDNDSDNDQVLDGAEDRNQNGSVDTNELNPEAADTDADLIPDGIEDFNHNGVKDVTETDGTKADTDGDTIPDGTEDLNRNGIVNAGESNPRVVDSDNDGLNDNIEDANKNGLFDAGETNATNRDTDGDTLSDGTEDVNKNGARDTGESSPLLVDTDSDGLADNTEDADGDGIKDANETATFSSDTDCDGASDNSELSVSFTGGLKTNPLNPDTDGDGLTDGQELGATAPLANSDCATIVVDADPTSKTDPVTADTDGDNRADGCEDINRNGRVDAGELNASFFDSDGDNLNDAVEDADGDCIADANETNGNLVDTDGDGIGDAIETITGTDPLDPDTDGDNILDGTEDTNQDGVLDPGETDPNDTDTDNDNILDGIEDADRDGNVDTGETDPGSVDTDGDGINDGVEDANRNGVVNAGETDPRVPDTDGDGLSDGQEDALNTDPNDVDTDGDGLTDGDEVINGTDPLDPNDPAGDVGSGIEFVCSAANLKAVNFFEDTGGLSQGGDWTVALESTGVPINGNPGAGVPYVYTSATAAGGDHVAAFRDGSNEVAGFVLDVVPPVAGNTNATTQAQALVNRLTAGTAALGAAAGGVTAFFNGRPLVSPDNFNSVVDIQVNINLTAATDPNTMRNRVVGVLANRALNTFTGLPGAAGATTTTYILRFSSLVRTGIPGINNTRIVMLGGVLSAGIFNNNALVEGLELKDLSNGSALARAFSRDTFVCNPFVATSTPSADFIWMADISGSTDDDRGTIATAAGTVFTALANNGVDFRMGVVPHTENQIRTGSVATAGDLRSGFTRNQTTFINDMNNVTGTDGCEYGVLAGGNAITKALPRTTGAESATKLRSGSQLVMFYVSDEHEQAVENQAACNNAANFPLQTQTGINDGSRTINGVANGTPNATQQANIQTTEQPFINQILGEGGIAFGQLTPTVSPFCAGNNESGRGYFEVVNSTGGAAYRVCDADPGAVLQQIVDAVTGAASEFVLSDFPISATIRVGLVRQVTTGEQNTGIAGNPTCTAAANDVNCCDDTRDAGCRPIDVPRSAANGFDYDAAANSIFFRGATFRPAIDDKVTVSYRLYEPPVPPLICAVPLSPVDIDGDGIDDVCQCSANVATGACGVNGAGNPNDLCSLTVGTQEVCNTDPGVCACECKQDCGGVQQGAAFQPQANFECGQPGVCGSVCGDANNDGTIDCNNTCTGNFTCDTVGCDCVCLDTTPGGSNDCGGIIPAGSNQVCDLATCSAFCPTDCGGCPTNTTCDLASCTCIDNGNG